MGWAQGIAKIDTRWLYLALLLSFALPLVLPTAIPLKISGETRIVYDAVEALPAGSVVAIDVFCSLSSVPELQPPAVAVTAHLFTRPLKVVIWALVPEGPIFAQMVIDKVKPEIERYGKKYGEDYVLLGYIAGAEAAMSALMKDTRAVVTRDQYNNPIEKLPLMDSVRGAKDINLLFCWMAAQPDERIRQYSVFGGIKWVPINVSAWLSGLRPYLEAKQILSFVNGLRGAAEYEYLTKRYSRGTASMGMLSISHLMVVGAIILANVTFLYAQQKSKRGN